MLKVEMANNNNDQDQAKITKVEITKVKITKVKITKVGDKVVKEMDTNQAKVKVVSMDRVVSMDKVKVVSMDRVVSMDKVSLNMDKMVHVHVDKLLIAQMDDQTLEINNMMDHQMMVDWAN